MRKKILAHFQLILLELSSAFHIWQPLYESSTVLKTSITTKVQIERVREGLIFKILIYSLELVERYYKQNPREASTRSKIFLFSLVNMSVGLSVCGFVCLYGTSWPRDKRYRLEIWYTHSPRANLKTGFLFFRKSEPEGGQPRKAGVSREFSAYLFDCRVFFF